MNFRTVSTLFGKELLDLTRDRRTLISIVLLPVLVGPVMTSAMRSYIGKSQRQARVERYKVGVRDIVGIPELRDELGKSGLEVVDIPAPRAAVETRQVTFALEVTGAKQKPQIAVYSDDSEMNVGMARFRVNDAIERVARRHIYEELAKRNVPVTVLEPFSRSSVNVARPQKMMGTFIGRLLGFLLLIFLFNGAMFAAVDMTAGEKERKTLEILLVSGAARLEIVAAKVALATLTSMTTALLSLASYAFAFAGGNREGNAVAGFVPDAGTVILVLLLMLPVALVAAAATVAAALPAKSAREAMTYVTPGLFIVMMLGMTSFVADADLANLLLLVPFANFAQMVRQVLSGDWTWSAYLKTCFSNLVYCAIAVSIAVKSFSSEKNVFRS